MKAAVRMCGSVAVIGLAMAGMHAGVEHSGWLVLVGVVLALSAV